MHFCTALFHDQDSDPESLMHPYSYENEEYQEFEQEYTKKEAEEMLKLHNLKLKKKDDISIADYMQDVHGCYATDSKGNFGNRNNPNALYDWFEVGGRWRKILYPKGITKAAVKKRQDADMKDVSKYELKQYIELRLMKPEEYEREKNNFGKTTISIKELDVKKTLEMANEWARKPKHLRELFYTIICEESGIMDGEDFDTILEYWRKRNGCITVIDYHS
jgi:hypothetical protein